MGLSVRCDRCYCELSGIDDAYLLRHDRLGAYSLTSLNKTASYLLEDGEDIILCEDCMNGLMDYLGSGIPED